MSVTDDDIIKRRLLIEGEGVNDDRRMTAFMKLFLKWASTSNETPTENNSSYQRLLGMLANMEMGMSRSHQQFVMNKKECDNYQKINDQIEKNITEAHEKIALCKDELRQAKRVRRNRQEYDALAKVIQQHPDRQETLQKLEATNGDLQSMYESQRMLEQKLDLRRKQFHLLITAIHEMQRILQDDEETDSNMV